ncbi:Bro-N domain-containing protein [Campylobacter helveticus]|uniref:BRO-N domain-containing protein n=2 Tax=Campylobacter helveticus TaxID=28898 RepID=UPI0022EB4B4B|nr:BRO family protein [Campylobacter helveticus]
MNKELIFQREGQEIRIIKDESGEPLFCLRDICDSLGHSNSRVIKEAIQNEFQGSNFNLHPFQTQGGIQHFTMITEPQLYFMLMRSDKPKARDFRQWVINEVLPSIRKDGSYSVGASNEMFSLKDELIKAKNEVIKTKEELIETQRALLDSQKALISELKTRQQGNVNNMVDVVKINAKIKRTKPKPTKKLTRMEQMYNDLKFMIKVLSSIPQAGITQKMIWSYLYKVIIREFNYKKQLSIQIIKENREFLGLIHAEANELLRKAQQLSIQEQETLESANYHTLFELH